MEEIELRYLVPDAALFTKLRRLNNLGPLELNAQSTIHITDHYLDTEEHKLWRQGWACRLRHEDDRWLVTLKAPSSNQGARITRTECEIPIAKSSRLPANWPPGELSDTVTTLSGGAPLTKFVTIRQARQRALVTEGTRQIAELSLDRVVFRHAGRRQHTFVLECELLPKGNQSDLDYIATILVHHFGLLPDSRSKLQRALEFAANGHSPEFDGSVRYPPRTLVELLQRHNIDPDYVKAVAATAECLFTALQPVHQRDSALLPTLRAAAMLHDIGLKPGKRNHQWLGYAQLLLQPLTGWPDDTRLVTAAAAYLHRGKLSAKRLAKALPNSQNLVFRENVMCIAALVRLAAGLTPKSSESAMTFKTNVKRHSVVIELASAGAQELCYRAQKKSDLWQQLYVKKLEWRCRSGAKEQIKVSATGDEYNISPTDTPLIAGTKIIARQLKQMTAYAKAVRRGQDPEAVHDLRVSCRRIRFAFRLFKNELVSSLVAPCQKGLRGEATRSSS